MALSPRGDGSGYVRPFWVWLVTDAVPSLFNSIRASIPLTPTYSLQILEPIPPIIEPMAT